MPSYWLSIVHLVNQLLIFTELMRNFNSSKIPVSNPAELSKVEQIVISTAAGIIVGKIVVRLNSWTYLQTPPILLSVIIGSVHGFCAKRLRSAVAGKVGLCGHHELAQRENNFEF